MQFFNQESQAIATVRSKLTPQFVDVGVKLTAIGILAAIQEAPRPRRIVKIENGGLRERVGGAGAGGMKRIALHLDRPAVNGGCDQRNCAGAARHCRRVVKKFSWDRPLRAFGERDEMHLGTTATR